MNTSRGATDPYHGQELLPTSCSNVPSFPFFPSSDVIIFLQHPEQL